MTRLLLWIATLAIAWPVHAQEFVDGTHLVNEGTASVYVEYTHSTMTTAICDVREPTVAISNGIVGALDREVDGMTVLAREDLEYGNGVRVTAGIAPGVAVNCLCVKGCDVRVLGVADVDVGDGGAVLVGADGVRLKGKGRARKVPQEPDRGDLRATVEYGIRLLEEDKIAEFVLALGAPPAIDEAVERDGYPHLLEAFQSGHRDDVLAALIHSRGIEPEVVREDELVWFRIDDPEIRVPRDRVDFYRIDGRWYLGN